MKNCQVIFVKAIAVWLLLTASAVTLVTWTNPKMRAVLGMGWGLILLWIVIGGTLMYRYREPIRGLMSRMGWDWRLKFILFATSLALAEEAITTIMTNLAPLFGVKVGEAYITASTNYLDVLTLHSVVIGADRISLHAQACQLAEHGGVGDWHHGKTMRGMSTGRGGEVGQ